MRHFLFGKHEKLLAACSAIAVTLAGLAVSTPAFAKEVPVVIVASPDVIRQRISYADLNLASLAGEATLNRRVGGAIRSLCVEATDGGDSNFLSNLQNNRCRTSAWRQADPQIAQAVQRAHNFASTSIPPIAATAITIDLEK